MTRASEDDDRAVGLLDELEEIAEGLRALEPLGERRLQVYAELREMGVTYARIAQSAGVTEEAVVQAVLRWKKAQARIAEAQREEVRRGRSRAARAVKAVEDGTAAPVQLKRGAAS